MRIAVAYANSPRSMQLESILRRVHPIPGFVYGRIELDYKPSGSVLHIYVQPRAGSRAICSGCGQKRTGYDTLEPRHFATIGTGSPMSCGP